MPDELTREEKAALRRIANDDKTKNLNSEGLYFFKPALHIDSSHGRIFVSVPIPMPRMVKGIPVLDTQTMIVYNGGTFMLDEDELVSRGLFPTNMPILPFPPRWEMSDIKEFSSSVVSVDSVSDLGVDNNNYDTFESMKDILEYFLDLPVEEEYILYCVWAMMGHIYPIFNAVPFINLTGFKESGKSKLMAFFQQVCFNAESTNNTSPSALFHIVEQNMSTILIDEAEKLTGLEKEPDLRLLLNACYKKGGAVTRWNPDSKRAERNYVFAPVAIAAINPLEATLGSRSISRVMFKTITNKGTRDLTDNSYDWQSLRNRLYRFIFTGSAEIEKIYLTEAFEGLNCRHLEKWKPLLSIAKYLDAHGGEGKVFDGLRKLAEEEQEEGESLTETEEITLRSMDKIVTLGGEYFIKAIKKQMVLILTEEGNEKAIEHIPSQAIAAILRKFGFHSGKRKNAGIPYRINPSQIETLYKRYSVTRYSDTLDTPTTQDEATDTMGLDEEVYKGVDLDEAQKLL